MRPGDNVVAVRVHQWSAASYLEDQDQWWLPGHLPRRDARRAPGRRHRGRLAARRLPRRRRHDRRRSSPPSRGLPGHAARAGARGRAGLADAGRRRAARRRRRRAVVRRAPRLYEATVSSAAETIALRVGFRTVEIRGDRFLVNGRRVVFHGMNRHETHPGPRPRLRRGARPRRPRPHEAVQRQRDPHQPLPAASAPARPRRRARLLGDPRVRPRDARLREGRLARQPQRRPRLARRLPRPHPAHRRAGQEPPQHRDVVARQRVGHRRATSPRCRPGCTPATPGGPCTTRATTPGEYTDVYSRMYPSVLETARDRHRRLARPAAELHACAGRPAAHEAVPALRVRARDGQRAGRARPVRGSSSHEHPRLHGGFVWEWRDHGIRTTTPTAPSSSRTAETSARSCTTATS